MNLEDLVMYKNFDVEYKGEILSVVENPKGLYRAQCQEDILKILSGELRRFPPPKVFVRITRRGEFKLMESYKSKMRPYRVSLKG